jgi:hypothetical protein
MTSEQVADVPAYRGMSLVAVVACLHLRGR